MTTLTGGLLGITGLIAKGINPSANISQDLQIWGLSHLVAKSVSVFINGEDVGDLTVAADGSLGACVGAAVGSNSRTQSASASRSASR